MKLKRQKIVELVGPLWLAAASNRNFSAGGRRSTSTRCTKRNRDSWWSRAATRNTCVSHIETAPLLHHRPGSSPRSRLRWTAAKARFIRKEGAFIAQCDLCHSRETPRR